MTAIAPNILPIQQELFNFNFPSGAAGLRSLGALLNGFMTVTVPVGTIIDSLLTEAQWNTALGNPANPFWVLADGRTVTGSTFSSLTGLLFVPNLCGVMRRGKNNGAVTANNNPDGDLLLGEFTTDKFGVHTHSYDHGGIFVTVNGVLLQDSPAMSYLRNSTGAASGGGNETAPKNVTINSFIRIN